MRRLSYILLLAPFVALADTRPEDEEAMLAHLGKVADIYDAHRDACDKLAAGIEGYVTDNAESIKKLQDAAKKRTKEEKEAMAKKYQKQYQAIAAKMLPGLKKCSKDDKLKAASDKMKM